MLSRLGLATTTMLALVACDRAPEKITVAGSSTVYPFTKAVADAFAKGGADRPAIAIESTGTVAGMERFCAGVGSEFPDVVDASRRMRRAEFDKCRAKDVGDIIEVPIGLDGVALAESKAGPKLGLSRKDIYLALAANPMGKPNTARTWKDVNAALPAIPIRVLGPPATSGTRGAFVELMLEPGCIAAMPEAQTLRSAADPSRFDTVCRRIRSDGAYVEEGEDDAVEVEKLAQSPNTLGLIGYSYLERNAARLNGVPIDGVAPTYDQIASGKYPGFRSLYLYVKKKQIERKPALQEWLKQYAAMWNPDGPLAKQGLIPLPERQRRLSADAIEAQRPLEAAALP